MKPNIIYIYADDLGHGMLSCYGQKQLQTPNIDRLADEGVRFTRAYGTAFCAPARASLLTGLHDAHAGRWTFTRAGIYNRYTHGELSLDDIRELIHNTGIRPRDGQAFLATLAQKAGYATGQIGKLEWGFSTSGDELEAHGWNYHYGYYDHVQCHGFYPPYLFENGKHVDIPGNTRHDFGVGKHGMHPDGIVEHDPEGRAVHSQDLFDKKILDFLRQHRDEPFFLYHPSQLPHGPTYFPDIPQQLADNPGLTPVEKEWAAMVLRLDQTVGVILDELDRLGLAEKTLILFASDNGHTINYLQPGRCREDADLDGSEIDQLDTAFHSDTCGDVFDGNGGLAGLKTTNWEGGARIPFIMRWPQNIPAGKVSDHLISNYDTMATLADLLDTELTSETDGISFMPAARGEADAPQHDYIVYASTYGPSLVTRNGWKLRTFLRKDRILDFSTFGADQRHIENAVTCQLYDLNSDPAEKHNVADDHPQRVKHLLENLLIECDGNLVHGTPQARFAFWPRP